VGRFRADAELLRIAALFVASKDLLGRWPGRSSHAAKALPPARKPVGSCDRISVIFENPA
jgi:hypothetical protein